MVTAWLLPPLDVIATAPQAGILQSFYVATGPGFGNLSRRIVSVEPVGRDARVRVMVVAAVHEFCPDVQLVTAAERVVRGATVQAVAGMDICGMPQKMIDQAQAHSHTPSVHSIDYMGESHTVVADCSGRQWVLELNNFPPEINFETLHRRAPAVSALWDLTWRLPKDMLTAGSAVAHETLGTSLLPELRSTKYAAAFGDELVEALEGYTGPPEERGLLPAELLERDALPLVNFVAPKFPPIAESARVAGDVRLRLTVDTDTGTVTGVERLSGVSLLADSAEQAARAWKFDPPRTPHEAVDVTLRFRFRCRKG